MSNKKEIKVAFNALLNKSAKGNFEALEERLQPQSFTLTASIAVPRKNHIRFAYTAASLVLLTVVTGIVASVVFNRTGSSVFSNNNNSLWGQYAAARSSNHQVASTKGDTSSQKGTNTAASLAFMPFGPQYLNYNHRIYIGKSAFDDERMDIRNKLIGYINFEGRVPIYSIKNQDVTKGICLWSTSNSKINYFKYNYLCGDSFAINGKTYRITSPLNVNLSFDILKGSVSSENTSNDYKINWNISDQDSSRFQAVNAILGKELGKIPFGGTVYAIDEINSSEAVCVNRGDNWFVISKADGYSGKTVDDVMKDKGIGIEDLE